MKTTPTGCKLICAYAAELLSHVMLITCKWDTTNRVMCSSNSTAGTYCCCAR